MNTAQIYSKAAGREVEVQLTEEEQEKLALKRANDIEYNNWLALDQTQRFFNNLASLEQEYLAKGRDNLCSGFNSESGIKALIKAKTIREILELYGKRYTE